LDSEQGVLETVAEILNELPNDKVKSAFCIERKDVNGRVFTVGYKITCLYEKAVERQKLPTSELCIYLTDE
jgi:hypothetical protein